MATAAALAMLELIAWLLYWDWQTISPPSRTMYTGEDDGSTLNNALVLRDRATPVPVDMAAAQLPSWSAQMTSPLLRIGLAPATLPNWTTRQTAVRSIPFETSMAALPAWQLAQTQSSPIGQTAIAVASVPVTARADVHQAMNIAQANVPDWEM